MKNQTGLILLGVVCIGLAIAFFTSKKQASEQKKADLDTIVGLSNKLVSTTMSFEDQRQVNAVLEKDLATQKTALNDLTNNYSRLSETLVKAESTIKLTEEEVKKREAKIAELETQNQALETQRAALDKQAVDLSNAITNLQTQIADTERKLASAEGDKAFLEKELKRLVGEKADLERQFSDLAVLRAQVAKLKEELSIARRVEWIRQGLFASTDQKGAQKLVQGINAPAKAPVKPTYDLNVEVTADGSVKVIPPATNRPPATAPATR